MANGMLFCCRTCNLCSIDICIIFLIKVSLPLHYCFTVILFFLSRVWVMFMYALICCTYRYRLWWCSRRCAEKGNANVAILLNRQKQRRLPNLMYISTRCRDNIVIITGKYVLLCTQNSVSEYSYRKRPSPTDPINNQYHYAIIIAHNSNSLLGFFHSLNLLESSWLFRFPNFLLCAFAANSRFTL